MARYFKIYRSYLQQYLKSLIEYRADFLLGLIGFILVQVTGVVFIQLIFQTIPTLQGWSFAEVLFIYGFAQIPRGIDHILTDNLWIFAWKTIAQGEFDRYLLRPLNPLFQLLAERFQPDGFGEIVIGFFLVSSAAQSLKLHFNFADFVWFILAVIAATVIYTAIKLAAASLAFWLKFAQSYLFMVYQLSTFVKYPLSIYPRLIQNFLTFVIPFAFTGYYPAAYFLGRESFTNGIVLTSIISIIAITLAYQVWRIGLKSYESSGN